MPFIIDGMKVQNDDYKEILKTLSSIKFKNSLKIIQSYVYGGEHPIDGQEHTSLIMRELEQLMNPGGKNLKKGR